MHLFFLSFLAVVSENLSHKRYISEQRNMLQSNTDFFFSYTFFSMFSQEQISLQKDSKTFFHTEKFGGEYYTG